jgi:hypothetical protein
MKSALAIAISLIMAACANSVRNPATGLVGEWRYADTIQSCHYVFKNDGTFSGEVVYQGAKVSQFKGKWSVQGDQLLYDYVSDAMGNIPPGSKDSDKLVTVAGNYFVIEARDRSKRRYHRIK